MRGVALLSCVVLIAACGGSEEAPAVDSPAVASTSAPAAAISLTDLAGKWTQVVRGETGDSVLATSEVVATADPAGWTMTFPGGPPIPLRVTASGDSIITDVGPYESVLRKGVQVTANGVLRHQDGKLVGLTTARYQGAGTDSVLRMRTELTRAP